MRRAVAVAVLALAAALLGAPAVRAGGGPDADDVLPAALDALFAQPDDTLVFGIPDLAPAHLVVNLPGQLGVRSLAALGDVDGDGVGDVAVGHAPGAAPASLQVRDGAHGALLWSATPDGGGFRTLRGLSARDGLLVAAACSPHARVACLVAADGAPVWTRDLAPGGASPDANLLVVAWTDDLDGDGVADVLVGGGRGVDALVALSGVDGETLWTHAAGDSVVAVARTVDLDLDGRADVLAAGGDETPFLAALSAADGSVLWSVPLPGPGSAVLALDDVDDDGVPDVAAGSFAAPATSLGAWSGADGAPLWTADFMPFAVTALASVSDVDGDGARDVAVGSFDSAVSCVLAGSGLTQWRREGSSVNGGQMLDVVSLGDLDGNGGEDVVTVSQDHHAYLIDGLKGFPLCVHDVRSRGGPVAALGDADGDGRTEFAAGGARSLHLLGGDSGTAAGPVVTLASTAFETYVNVYAYPTKTLVVMGSLGTGSLVLPGYSGVLGLDLSLFGLIHVGTAPAAGESGYVLPNLSRDFLGLTLYVQAATILEPGHGLLSQVVSQPLVR